MPHPQLMPSMDACRLQAAQGYSYNGLTYAAEQGQLAAVGLYPTETPCIDLYRVGLGSLELTAHLKRPTASILSTITALPGSSEFATGEADPCVSRHTRHVPPPVHGWGDWIRTWDRCLMLRL